MGYVPCCALPFRGKRHDPDTTVGRFLPAIKLVGLGSPDVLNRVSSTRAGLRLDVRTFHMKCLHRMAFG